MQFPETKRVDPMFCSLITNLMDNYSKDRPTVDKVIKIVQKMPDSVPSSHLTPKILACDQFKVEGSTQLEPQEEPHYLKIEKLASDAGMDIPTLRQQSENYRTHQAQNFFAFIIVVLTIPLIPTFICTKPHRNIIWLCSFASIALFTSFYTRYGTIPGIVVILSGLWWVIKTDSICT